MAELEHEENEGVSEAAIYWKARRYTLSAVGDLLLGDIEVPVGAIDTYLWEPHLDAWYRHFRGTQRKAAGFHVDICGVQEVAESQTVDREVHMWGGVEESYFTSAQARELAATLLAAADELDEDSAR